MKAVLFDFDGVLYPETPKAIEMYVAGAVDTALHFGFKGSHEDALTLAKRSTGTHNESSKVFIEELKLASWAQWLPVFAQKVDHRHLQPDTYLKQAIINLKIEKGILTNAHAHWLHKVITHIDLHDVFDADKMISTDMVSFQGKASSDAGFRYALERLGSDAKSTVMIEDIPRNLRLAKKMGMKTMLVLHGRTYNNIPDWVDDVYETTLQAIHAI